MIALKLLKVTQMDKKPVFVGKVSFRQIHEKVKLTQREGSDGQEFQRKTDKNRINKISKFLENLDEDICPFPTPIVLSLSVETEIKISQQNIEEYLSSEDAKAVLFDENNDNEFSGESQSFDLYLPERKDYIFVVDGQHRFEGVRKYIDENDGDFDFLATFLLDYDIYEQSAVFANINFTQKPVNRSLFYDIYGTFPGKNEITFTHFLMKRLNEKSDLAGIVKMLGTGKGILSLAFLVKTFLSILDKKGILYDIYLDFEKDDSNSTKHLNISNVLNLYLEYFYHRFERFSPEKVEKKGFEKKVYSSFDYEHYLFKAIGMYGVLMLFNDLFEHGALDINLLEKEDVNNALDNVFNKFTEDTKVQEILFDDSSLKGAGSASLQVRFYQKLYGVVFGEISLKERFPKVDMNRLYGDDGIDSIFR